MSNHTTDRLNREIDAIVEAEGRSLKIACMPCAVLGGIAVLLVEMVAWEFAGLVEIVSRFGAFW